MSDDRFKQARRSLIDRHNQRQQQDDWGDSFSEDDDFEDEATAMVNLDGQPAFAPPPNFAEPTGKPTEMFHIDQDNPAPPPSGGVQMRSHSGVQPSYDSFGGQPPQQQQQTFSPSAPAMSADPNQSLVIGGGGGMNFEENTAFINLNDFAAGGETFTPDDTAAGYEGSTQFVNIAALQAQGPPGQTPVEHDAVLKQSYQFAPESIQEGEFTLIFAQNHSGQPVILKRIWEGDPNGMPMPIRQRIAALDQIRHPQLVGLTGMVAAPSGAWVELSRPPGYRLTDVIMNNGPQDPNVVAEWVRQVAEILEMVHAQSFHYASLTTDAIWIQEDGTVLLEPFDVLAFEQRGNLGVFGPPEMSAPPDQRLLFPATDVYCLAAVMVACLTGMPLNLGALQTLDKKTAAAVGSALNQDPSQRPATPLAFTSALGGKRAKKAGSKGGKPGKAKLLIPAVLVVGCVALAAAYFLRPKPQPPKPQPPVAGDLVVANNGTTGEGAQTAGETNQGEDGPPVAVAGDVTSDPRLKIKTSFVTNPSSDEPDAPDPEDLAEASKHREEASSLISDLKGLSEKSIRARYSSALSELALAIRLSGGMTAADEEILAELSKSSVVQEIKKDYFKRLDEGLKEERISRVKQVYPQLAAVDSQAKETKFFVKNKAVDIKTIKPIE